ncbi:MAG: hypothetical protein JWP36_253 [Paucimonas sp.]|nr:hypothetical protein [Paucimonas sp.]
MPAVRPGFGNTYFEEPELDEPVPPEPDEPEPPLDLLAPPEEPDMPLVPDEPLELAPAPASSRFWQPARPPNAMLTASNAINDFVFFISVLISSW